MLKFACFVLLLHSGQPDTVKTEGKMIHTIPNFPTSDSDDRKYYFGTAYKGNFLQALQFCNYHDTSLLSIESAEEDEVVFRSLANFLGDGRYTFWTSGTLLPEDHWVWLSTGRPIVYVPGDKQPKNMKKACVEIQYVRSNGRLVWKDADCTLARHAICEIALPKSVGRLEEFCANCTLPLAN